jgi:hypothetical protein
MYAFSSILKTTTCKARGLLKQTSLVIRVTITEYGAELAYKLSHLQHLLQET